MYSLKALFEISIYKKILTLSIANIYQLRIEFGKIISCSPLKNVGNQSQRIIRVFLVRSELIFKGISNIVHLESNIDKCFCRIASKSN